MSSYIYPRETEREVFGIRTRKTKSLVGSRRRRGHRISENIPLIVECSDLKWHKKDY
jgi:hypothetical protein